MTDYSHIISSRSQSEIYHIIILCSNCSTGLPAINNGLKGEPGVIGHPGPKGEPGERGSSALGEKGDKGDPGRDGFVGAKVSAKSIPNCSSVQQYIIRHSSSM